MRQNSRFGSQFFLHFFILSVFCCAGIALPASAVSQTRYLPLPQVVRVVLQHYFSASPRHFNLTQLSQQIPVAQAFQRPRGVFVTLSVNHRSRACWGSIYPTQGDTVKETIYATYGALTKDYRYPAIRRSEWQSLKPQVTVIKAIEPIQSIHEENPIQDGLMVRSGGKSGILLPGEATDASYQLVQCKLKAGIQPKEAYQMYRIVADVYQ